MAENRSPNSDFGRAFDDAKKQAASVAGEVSDAAQNLYGQAADSASQVAGSATRAASKTAGSFEKALRNTNKEPALYCRRYRARTRMAVRKNASTNLIASS